MANWSSYNKGAKGYKRDEESNIKLSLSFLKRPFNQSTIDLHIKNRTNKKHSEEIKRKMSASKSSWDNSIILVDVNKRKKKNRIEI